MCKWVAWGVGLREKLHQIAGHRIDAVGGNDVSGKGGANEIARRGGIGAVGERIVNGHQLAGLVPRIGEIALPFERRRHTSRTDQSLYPAQALIRNEEESSVLAVVEMRDNNRSTPGAAELVEAACRLTQSAQVHEEILGAEFVVAEKFEQAAVQLVRSGLADQIDHATSRVGEFRAEIVGLNLVFVYHVYGVR